MINEKIIYCAGFFDGEGSILLNKLNISETNKSIKLALQIDISQIDELPLLIFQEIWGGKIHINQQTGRNPLFKLRYTGTKASLVLSEMLPYLILKKEEANVAIAYISRIQELPKPSIEERLVYREQLHSIRRARKEALLSHFSA